MVCGCSSRAVAGSVSNCPSTCARRSHCVHAVPAVALRSLGIFVDTAPACCAMCGTRLGADDVADAGARGRWVALQASDGTHLACKLHATHPGEAHDGGGRGVESGGCRKRLAVFDCCRSMMEVATLTNEFERALIGTVYGKGLGSSQKEQRDRGACSGFSRK